MPDNLKPVSVQPAVLLHIDKVDLSSLSYEELIEMGRSVMEVKMYTQWILGRLGAEVFTRYGEVADYAKKIGTPKGSLYQYVYVYKQFTNNNPDFHPEKYYGSIPWGMLHMVATKTDEPEKLLNQLVDEGATSMESAYKKIKEKETGRVIPPKPSVIFQWDDNRGKWMIKFRTQDLPVIGWDLVTDDFIEEIRKLL